MPWPSDQIASLSNVLSNLEISFILCTGRQLPYVEASLQAIGAISKTPSIAENGACLYYPKSKAVIVNPAIQEETREAMTEIRSITFAHINNAGGNREYGKEFSISLNPHPHQSIEEFYEEVSSLLNKYAHIVEIHHSRSAVDITPKGVNKGSGLRFLAEIENFNLDRAIMVGDSNGDLPALEIVRYPACPSNADESVKKICNYVSPYETTTGVIDIIKHYLLK